jgi:3-oxoacyl-[acyl-carrier-protein] synthase-1
MAESVQSTDSIAVVASGAVTSVGLSAASTCAAIRASHDNFTETHFIDDMGQPLVGAPVPPSLLGLAEEADGSILGGEAKLAAMFIRAAKECVRGTGGIKAAHTALLLLGPETTRPGFNLDKLQRCFSACETAVGHSFHAASRITQIGSPGLAAALEHAREAFANHSPKDLHAVLIAGLDSLLNTEDINDGLGHERLLTEQNSDGFIPGEAAACVLVVRESCVAEHAKVVNGVQQVRPAILRIAGVAQADETETLDAERPSRGVGLAKAIKAGLAQAALPAHGIHQRLSDVTAESYFFEEASYAWSRVLRVRSPEGYRFHTPMNRVGHIGAAMGPLMLTLLLDMARKGWAAGPASLIHLSSAGQRRGAIVAVAT